MVKIGLFFASLLALAVPAMADWAYHQKGGKLDGGMKHYAYNTSGNYILGLRCRNQRDLVLLFLTPEFASEDLIRNINISHPRMMIRVDDNPVFEIEALIEKADVGSAFIGPSGPEVINQFARANQVITVAVNILGDVYHETEFNVAGSTKAAIALGYGCGFASN